jgi:hypothetical protein
MKKAEGKRQKRKNRVIRLEDLAPREDVKGGTSKPVFGQTGHSPLGGREPTKNKSKTGKPRE